MPTDVPFWRSQTGAQQRILHLVLGLSHGGIDVRTFYIGPVGNTDRKLIDQRGLDVEFQSSDDRPDGIGNRIAWRMGGLANRLRKTSNNALAPLTIEDFNWPWARTAFRKSVLDYQPDFVLCQYITMAYLIDAIPKRSRSSIHTIVDTHDVLSIRAAQFKAHNYPHWIEIDQATETAALANFDTVMAITPDEQTVLQQWLPNADVMLVAHSVSPLMTAPSQPRGNEGGLIVGYLGSNNLSNVHAIENFLKVAWPKIRMSDASIRLRIGGSVCQGIESNALSTGVHLVGRLEDVATFYHDVDVMINPVAFGTGLKIKNCESIAFGKPLIATRAGMASTSSPLAAATITVDDVHGFAPAINELAEDRAQLIALQSDASIARDSLTDAVYDELIAKLTTSRSQ